VPEKRESLPESLDMAVLRHGLVFEVSVKKVPDEEDIPIVKIRF